MTGQTDPATLGRLIALYEHKVFTQSVAGGAALAAAITLWPA